MTDVLLIYPFFMPRHDKSVFRFPPLGLAYVASGLRAKGHQVSILDCTFLSREEAMAGALSTHADVVGVYSMITMREDSLVFAKRLRNSAGLLVAGGPLPSSDPAAFLQYFDVVVRGEGEAAMVELVEAYLKGTSPLSEAGIVTRETGDISIASRGTPVRGIVRSPERPLEPDLDRIPFPARDLLPNQDYIRHGRMKHGYAITSLMSTRGCPFQCEFCSNVVFGTSYRERSAESVVDEVEQTLSFGYDRIHFADDVFTLNRERVHRICREIVRRRLHFGWECLGRVDSIDGELASLMKRAGCERIFFGIESGSEEVLRLMNKRITTEKARLAVEAAHAAGLKTGAFFILFYPGETDETVLATLQFAGSLPLDYLSFTMPYPIPGTRLFERVKNRAIRDWRQSFGLLFDHTLVFDADFSQAKMRFAILKGQVEFEIKRRLGGIAPAALKLLQKPTTILLRAMR